MSTIIAKIDFPDQDEARGAESAESLLNDILQDGPLRKNADFKTAEIARTDPQALDFGATLIAVLGTPAVIFLARTIKSWVERTGTTSISLNGVRIDNVRSVDVADIVKALNQGTTSTEAS